MDRVLMTDLGVNDRFGFNDRLGFNGRLGFNCNLIVLSPPIFCKNTTPRKKSVFFLCRF